MDIDAPSGVIGLWDEAFVPPEQPAFLREAAKEKRLFFVDAGEHVVYRTEVIVDALLPHELASRLEPRLGSFGLYVPSGRLCVNAIPSKSPTMIDVEPGGYLVTPYGQPEFDGKAFDAEMQRIVGEAEWRHRRRVDDLGAIGCFAWPALTVLLIIPLTRVLWPVLVPLCVLPTLAYWILRRLPRYRAVEAARVAHETSLPHLVFLLRRTEADVPGGWVRER